MLISCIADIHLYPFSAFSSKNQDGINTRSLAKICALNEVLSMSIQRGCKEVWLLGDIFHVKGKMPPDEYLELCRWCKKVADAGLQLRIIAGNHDYVRDAVNRTLLQVVPCGMVIHDTIVVEDVDGAKVVFVPWRNRDMIPFHGGDILVGHIEVRGSSKSLDGIKDEDGVDPNLLSSFKVGLFGHYHLRQKVAENAYYVGSLLPDSFGEANKYGGFAILDTKKMQVEFVDLKGFPRFLTHTMNGHGVKELECKGDYVRVSGVRTMEEEESVLRELKNKGALAVVFERSKDYACQIRMPLDECKSVEDMVGVYVDGVLTKDAKLDRDRLIEVGKGLTLGLME